MNYIAIDFETANFKSSSACALGIAVVENGQIIETKSLLFKPNPNYFENLHISIHGITPEMVKDKPNFAEIWSTIKPYFQNKIVIAHNASFDFSVLRSVLNVYNLEFPELDYYCSMLLSKKSIVSLTNYKLSTICKHFNIDLNHHNAESDAKAAALITIELCKRHNVNSLNELSDLLKFKNGKIYSTGYKPFSNTPSHQDYKPKLELIPETNEFDKENPFYLKTIVFTGKLSAIPRKDAHQMVLNVGGHIKDNITKETNFLVLGTYDFNQFGEGFKSEKLEKAELLIQKGHDLEIISELDFFSMVNFEKTLFEITIDQIEKHSKRFLERNKYNDLSGKNVYFSSDLTIDRFKAFQMVGNCSGFGHDYDNDVIAESNYFVISDKTFEQLKKGVKSKCVIDFEQIRNKALTHGNIFDTILIHETTFLEYMKRRDQFQKGEIEMNIYEWDVKTLND